MNTLKAMHNDETVVARYAKSGNDLVLVRDSQGRHRLLHRAIDREYREITIMVGRKTNGGPRYAHMVTPEQADDFAARSDYEKVSA